MGLYDYFSRVLFQIRQRPSTSDWNRLQTNFTNTLRWMLTGLGGSAYSGDPQATSYEQARSGFPAIGFYRDGFYVEAGPGAMDVSIRPGVGNLLAGPATATGIDGTNETDWTATSVLGAPAVLSAAQSFTVPAAPAFGSSRIDIIEVRADYLADQPATIGILNIAREVFDPTVKNRRLGWDLHGRTGSVNAPAASTAPISYVRGVTGVGGIDTVTEPTASSGYIKIARINATLGITSISQADIADRRPKILPGGVLLAGAHLTIPGIVGGIADPALLVDSIALPQGFALLVAVSTATPPSAGTSYTATCVLIGGDSAPRTIPGSGLVGSATATADNTRRTCQISRPLVTDVSLGLKAIFDGTNTDYIVLTGTTNLAVGQLALYFTVEVSHVAGSALQNTEGLNLQLMIGQG